MLGLLLSAVGGSTGATISEAESVARRSFWDHLGTYEALVRELTPEAQLLLKWEHSKLALLACSEGRGPDCCSDAAVSEELRQLLRARERAYIVAVAALKRWREVETAYGEFASAERQSSRQLSNRLVELSFLEVKNPFGGAHGWAAALSLVPAAPFFQHLHASLPTWRQSQVPASATSCCGATIKGKAV